MSPFSYSIVADKKKKKERESPKVLLGTCPQPLKMDITSVGPVLNK